eukprot:m.116250 g.116250  ORF g.116250 m.116250 type:complete len:436 (-) comp14227_c0_seq7:2968-4275(-)
MQFKMALCCLLLASLVADITANIINFEDAGGVPDTDTLNISWYNGALLNKTLKELSPGDQFVIPNKTFHVMGGLEVYNLSSVVLQIDGTLSYSDDFHVWPRVAGGRVKECLHLYNPTNITFTSSGTGTFNGNGAKWWGLPGVGYLERGENRPRLLTIDNGKDILIENLFFLNSPYWNTILNVDGLEIRNCAIDARRDKDDGHDFIDLTAFNTDGFDVTGQNVYIHDVEIWNQDDCIAVKDGSKNMLFERVTASGLGLTIGSISGSIVENITFRDSYMKHTVKGIYMKFRGGSKPGLIKDVLYENIVMDEPESWPIWIGPAQQADNSNPCFPNPCSLCWPDDPDAKCEAPAAGLYQNITLRNITINSPKTSPGVILGNITNPMQGVVFDNVVVNNPGKKPWGDKFYLCEGVSHGVATGNTKPVPPCFEDRTIHSIN